MFGPGNVSNNPGGDESSGRENWDVAAELQSLEARLASLSPRPDRLDRDRLMFQAGQASLFDASPNRTKMFGVKLESGAWPAAFAAMSAVAATLLVILIARPENGVRQPLPPATSVRQTYPSVAIDVHSNELMLSPLDARIGDIDRWLTRDELRSEGTGPSMEQFQDLRLPILTPARWQQVLNDREPLDTSPAGASNLRPIPGARS